MLRIKRRPAWDWIWLFWQICSQFCPGVIPITLWRGIAKWGWVCTHELWNVVTWQYFFPLLYFRVWSDSKLSFLDQVSHTVGKANRLDPFRRATQRGQRDGSSEFGTCINMGGLFWQHSIDFEIPGEADQTSHHGSEHSMNSWFGLGQVQPRVYHTLFIITFLLCLTLSVVKIEDYIDIIYDKIEAFQHVPSSTF